MALPNNGGVEITGFAEFTTIGGTATGAGNLISGNLGYGVTITISQITGVTPTGDVVQGNQIGTDITGTVALPDNGGVDITDSADDNTIGGTAAGAGNIIAFNTGNGRDHRRQTRPMRAPATRSWRTRSTPTPGSGSTWATTASRSTTRAATPAPTCSRTSRSSRRSSQPGERPRSTDRSPQAANTTYRIEFFSNATADPSGYGQGQTFLTYADVTTDADGTGELLGHDSQPTERGPIP